MTLRIESLTLRDFRNYDHATLENLGDVTVLVGENAIGKTNIIEGVQLLTALSSFRHATIEQLVRHGQERGRLEASISDGNRQLAMALTLEGHSKKYQLNGKAKRPADLKGLVPSVIFTPDDLDLVKGSMTKRRAALDALGSQVNKNYYIVRRDYEKVIRHKNRLLKEEASPALLATIDEMLITVGSQLVCYRDALFRRLVTPLVSLYEGISSGREVLGMQYVPSWSETPDENGLISRETVREALSRALHERAGEEQARRRAVVGPHADHLVFTLDGQDASLFGSQGQQRSIVLAYKLAEAAVIEDILEQKPVLLLDDVMSELDGQRREALVAHIAQGSQTFLTTANLAYFDQGMLERSDVRHLPLTASDHA